MTNVRVKVLIPAFRSISGYIVAKYIYPARIERITVSQRAVWIRHTSWVSRLYALTCF